MAEKLLKTEIMVVCGGETIPYEALTQDEKDDLGKKLNRRARKSVANMRGYDVTFYDAPPLRKEEMA